MGHTVRQLRVTTSGPALSVLDHEGGEPAVLALHGLASNARWWDLVAERLVPEYRVLAPDLRGHGLSDRPDSGYDFDTVVDDLHQVRAQLHPGALVVAGHSWGASVALVYAATHPDGVLGVVCVDGGASDLRAYFGPDWSIAEQTMRPPELRGITRDALLRWMRHSPLREGSDPETAAAILGANFEDDESGTGTLRPRLALANHMQIARHLYELDGFDVMQRVRCPVLLLPAGRPSHEDLPKAQAVERARAVLGERARVVWVDGSHDIPVQRPDEVAAAVRSFLAGLA